jgi:hypothetical protein
MRHTRPTAVWRTAGEVLRRWDTAAEQSSRNHEFHRHTQKILVRIRRTQPGKSIYGYRQSWLRLHADVPAPTVMGNHGGVFVHPWRDRCLTPRELAVLQDFPDDYLFCGTKSDIWIQIGNAVPIGLARAVGQSVLQMLAEPAMTTLGFRTCGATFRRLDTCRTDVRRPDAAARKKGLRRRVPQKEVGYQECDPHLSPNTSTT